MLDIDSALGILYIPFLSRPFMIKYELTVNHL